MAGAFLCMFMNSAAQSAEISKLKQTLATTQNDSVKIFTNSELCYLYTGLKYDSALYYGNQGLALARSVQNKTGIRQCLTDLGALYFQAGKYPESTRCFLEALKMAEQIKDERGVVNTLNNLAVVYHNLKEYDKALGYYERALAFDERTGNLSNVSMRLTNIGILYKDKGDRELAVQKLEQSLNIGQQAKDSSAVARALNNLAEVYGLLGKRQKSKDLYRQAYLIQKGLGNSRGIFITTSNLASAYADIQQYDSALYYGKLSLDMAQTFNAPNYYKTTYEILASIYQHKKDYKTALDYFRLYQTYKDSIFNEENSRMIGDMKTQYEVDKKAAELNARAAVEKEKAEALRLEEERRYNMIVAFISGILLLVCIFSFFLYQRFKLTKKQKFIIELQKKEVEQKNKEITDSINYAKRLQDAILPPRSAWNSIFPESFIYYHPKDIVAGDFYFLEQVDDYVVFAAADCTGHGVPGAMVSMVCSNALSRAVKEFKITEAGKILDKVTDLVQETFSKSESEVRDGMDISICTLNRKNLELSWAGANNPLWFVRQNEQEIQELKPDKQPVGKTEHRSNFNTQRFVLQKGDILYLFTDGFADQFGGESGKKFKLKKLKSLLTQNLHLSMPEQHEVILQSFETWKGQLEQIDDLCVIGIKI